MSRNFDTSSGDAYYSYNYDDDHFVVLGDHYQDYGSTGDHTEGPYNFNYANYKIRFLVTIYEVLNVTSIKALVELIQVSLFILEFRNFIANLIVQLRYEATLRVKQGNKLVPF